jgi:hypothetical protein
MEFELLYVAPAHALRRAFYYSTFALDRSSSWYLPIFCCINC